MEAQLQRTICKYNIRFGNGAFKKLNRITISLLAFAYAFFLVIHSEQCNNTTNEFSAIQQQLIFMSQFFLVKSKAYSATREV